MKTPRFHLPMLLFVFAFLCPAASALAAGGDPPDISVFRFQSQETKVLPGSSTEKKKGWNCKGNINPSDRIGRLAVVSTHFQNGCFTDGRYNHREFKVERGVVADTMGKRKFEAYRVYKPARQARKFLGSKHAIFYQFPTKEPYTVYLLEGSRIKQTARIRASRIRKGKLVKTSLIVSTLKSPATYIFVPSKEILSEFAALAKGVEGARVKKTPLGDVLIYRYRVNGVPFDTRSGFNHGPESHKNIFGITRQFFMVKGSTNEIGVVWQDKKNSGIRLTWFGRGLTSPRTLKLKISRNHDLAAATSDGRGNIFYLTIQKGTNAKRNRAKKANLHKANANGRQLKKRALNTLKKGLNIVAFGDNNVASLRYEKGLLGLILARTMHRSPDGLNHQGAIAAIYNAGSLKLVKNWGQTSGHSLGNVLTANGKGEFVGIDLADNYPRGVHLHKFSTAGKTSRIVFTFKTKHGQKPRSPAGKKYGLYSRISKGRKKFYKWSNDNRTYTELGGVIDGNNSFTVFFATESYRGKALDNSRTGQNLNDSRNIGMVRVKSDLGKNSYDIATWNVVPDRLVLSKGKSETGGFYAFGGKWSGQRNTGVVWLTDYKNHRKENVSRLKAVKLKNAEVLLLWEKWTPNRYVNTYAMKVGPSGEKISAIVELGNHVRLNRRDDPLVHGGKVYLVAGNKVSRSLELIVLNIK